MNQSLRPTRARPWRAPALAWRVAAAVVPLFGCDATHKQGVVRLTPTANAAPSGSDTASRAGQLVGVGSCTASGCHGGGSTNDYVGSEYNIWISQDPHADAYSVLYDARSLRMVRLLDGKSPDEPVEPYNDSRCLACHSTVDPVSKSAPPHLLADGVSCEACHGPAKQWLADHYRHRLPPHPARRDASWLRDRGMLDTDRLATRIEICTNCHVGGAGDVNHDLIAAGHPRLQFDYGAYFRKLPAHWDPNADRKTWGASFDAVQWAMGQVANSRAALERLAARAAGDGPWPELSEWSCADCHHDLLDDAARQERLASRGGLAGLSFDWDDWHHHLTRRSLAAVESAWGIDAPLAEEIQREMTELASMVADIQANRAAVAEKANSLAKRVDAWAIKLEGVRPDAQAVDRLFREMAASHRRGGVATWSEAALAYDALASLHQSRIDGVRQRGGAISESDRQITRVLTDFYNELWRTRDGTGQPYRSDIAAGFLDELGQALGDGRAGA